MFSFSKFREFGYSACSDIQVGLGNQTINYNGWWSVGVRMDVLSQDYSN